MGLFFQNAVITSIRAAYKVYTSPPGVSFRPRTSHGFVFYLEGSCRYVYPDRTFTAEANTFLYLPKGVAYAIEPQGDSVCLLINFDTADPPAEKAFCRLYPNASQIRDRFYAAVSEGRQKKAGHVPEITGLLYEIIARIQSAENTGYLPYKYIRRLEPATAYIQEQYTNGEIRISALAELCGLSTRYFTKLFWAYYGTTPKKYILNLQIDLAKSILSNSAARMTDIAAACGFADVSCFSKTFKQIAGMTPSDYRKINIVTESARR